MKSYQVVEFGEPLELREYENPQPKGDEVLVKITACGVCHSDLHLADGYFDLGDGKRITLADRGTKLPFTPGHEITGTVVALGENVKGIKINQTEIHLKTFSVSGGISNNVANLPTIKLPDQNKVAKIKNE